MQKLCRVQKSCQPKKEQVRRLPCPHPAGLPDPSAYKIMILDRLIIRQEKKRRGSKLFSIPLKSPPIEGGGLQVCGESISRPIPKRGFLIRYNGLRSIEA